MGTASEGWRLLTSQIEDSGFKRFGNEKARFSAKGMDLRLHRCNASYLFRTEQDSEHAGDGKAGLPGKQTAFMFVNEYGVCLEIDRERDGFRLTPVK